MSHCCAYCNSDEISSHLWAKHVGPADGIEDGLKCMYECLGDTNAPGPDCYGFEWDAGERGSQ